MTDSTNPYAPPTAPTPVTQGSINSALKWCYLAGSCVPMAAFLSGVLAPVYDGERPVSTEALTAVRSLLSLAYLGATGCGLVWIRRAWSVVPEGARVGWTGKHTTITPGQALGYLFVPGFNLLWAFALSAALCNSIDGLSSGARRLEPTRKLGACAAACQATVVVFTFAEQLPLVWFAGVLLVYIAAPALWFAFMMQIERALHRLPDA
jgi:hypothetical protein